MDDADKRAIEMGRRTLANLAEGRSKAHRQARDRAAPFYLAIRRAIDRDILDGHGERGRAGRIAERLPPRDKEGLEYYSTRQVQRVLDTLAKVT